MTPRRPLRRRIPTSRAVDDPRWMPAISSLTDHELDELLAGRTPEGRGELAPLADVAIAVRERTAGEPAPVMAYSLRQAVARGSMPLPRPRRLMPVAVAAFALAGVSLAGAANALPAPVQNMVAEAGDLVGVDIPHSTDDDVVETHDLSTTTDAARPLAEGVGSDAEPKNQSGPTPGGTIPADPGTPGDMTPATPAIPPDHSSGGNESINSQGNGPTDTDADETDDDEGDDGFAGDDNGQGDANADAGSDQGTESSNGKAKGGQDGNDTGNADG